jgi:Caspase domain/Domain of unknown function (DUF4384)
MSKNRVAFYLITILFVLPGSAPASKPPSPQPAKRALLVGTDVYKNFPKNPTHGAEEDVRETKNLLIEKYGFQEKDIKLLLREEATANNIREAYQTWLIQSTRPGDRVFFLYSGHGTTVDDLDGDEAKTTPGDTKDEALAPYDAGDSSKSLILDDELCSYINQLSGRMAVLVFDSCFSGTVSRGSGRANPDGLQAEARYLPSVEEVKGETTRSGGKGGVDDYVVTPQSAGSRDLHLVVDKESIKAGGIVIFSAAQPTQLAYSVQVKPEYYRGAFTYLFNKYLQQPNMSLRALKSALTQGMSEFRVRNILKPGQEQTPYFEVYSTVSLEDDSLFGAELMTPAVALSNPVSTIKLNVSTLEAKKVYYFGSANGKPYNETVSYEIETNTPGYLYLIVFSIGDPEKQGDNVATRIYPNINEKDNRIEVGRKKIFRDPFTKEGFWVTEPEGKDIIVALLSSSKLNFGQETGYEKESYSWDEVFSLLRSRRFSEQVESLTRGQSAKGLSVSPSLDMTNWQSGSIVLEAKKVNK